MGRSAWLIQQYLRQHALSGRSATLSPPESCAANFKLKSQQQTPPPPPGEAETYDCSVSDRAGSMKTHLSHTGAHALADALGYTLAHAATVTSRNSERRL